MCLNLVGQRKKKGNSWLRDYLKSHELTSLTLLLRTPLLEKSERFMRQRRAVN
jgi:hypothetical protein